MNSKEKSKSIGSEAGSTLSVLYLGQILGALITIITFIYVTRNLGPSEYGVYVFAIGFAALVGAVGNFGIGSYMSRNLSAFSFTKNVKGISDTISSSYVLLFIIAILLTILGVGISGVIANTFVHNLSISYVILSIAAAIIFFSMVQNVNVHALAGFSSGKNAAITSLVVDIVQLFSIMLLLLSGFGVIGAVLGILLGNVVGSILGVYFMLSKAKKYKGFKLSLPTRPMLLEVFNFSFPLAVNNVFNTALQNFSILFLGFYVASAVIGNYGAALKGLNFATIAYGTMSMVILPLFSKINNLKKTGEKGTAYTKVMVYSLALTLPFIVFISAMAKPAVFLLLSKTYSVAPLYLTLITFGAALNLIAYYIGTLLASKSLTMKLLKYNSISAGIQFILLLVLTPIFGVLGVILPIFVIGGLINDTLLITAVKKNIAAKINYKKIFMCMTAALLLYIPLSIAFISANIFVELISGIILALIFYPIFITLLKVINAEDLTQIRNFIPKLPVFKTLVNYILSYTGFLIGLRDGK